MYNVSDRSIRNYRHKLNAREPFHIFLKTRDDIVEIYVDRGGYASQRNKDTKNFDLSLGDASRIIDFIATGKTLPTPTPVWSVRDKTSEEALRPVAGYKVVSGLPNVGRSGLADATELPKAEEQPVVELQSATHLATGKLKPRSSEALMRECVRLRQEGKSIEEIRITLGFKSKVNIYDYLKRAHDKGM